MMKTATRNLNHLEIEINLFDHLAKAAQKRHQRGQRFQVEVLAARVMVPKQLWLGPIVTLAKFQSL